MILEAMATLAAGIFGGAAALYINLAEHPARMSAVRVRPSPCSVPATAVLR